MNRSFDSSLIIALGSLLPLVSILSYEYSFLPDFFFVTLTNPINRLFNILHADSRLYLVFEFLDMDLKRYMDKLPKKTVLDPALVKKFTYQLINGKINTLGRTKQTGQQVITGC